MGAKVTGLDELREDLTKAADEILDGARGVVGKGLLNIKKETKARWGGLAHAPSLPGAVTYKTKAEGTVASGEVGPDKERRQGALGNLIEYGSINNAPIPALNPALDAEEPRFLKALEDLGGDLIEGKAVRSDGPLEDTG